MSSRGQMEQPFQVVTQKRPSGQARKVFNRDKPPTPRTQHATEDHNSTATAGTGGGSGRKRQSGSHHSSRDGGGRHSSARSGGSVVQMRAQHVEHERDGEGGDGGGTGHGHTNRHSWDPETAMQYQHGGTIGSSTKTTADKIERSQSARFDRVTDTNNRFERLNPDTEAPGETPRSGSTRSRKRNSRSASGSSSYRSRSPKRKLGKEGKEHKGSSGSGHVPDKVTHRDKEMASATNCDLEWDSSISCTQLQSDGDVFIDEQQQSTLASGPVPNSSKSGKHVLEEAESVDKTSGASAQGSGEGDGNNPASPAPSTGDELGDTGDKSDSTKTKSRLSYSRTKLLTMRQLPLSQKRPESLNGKFFRGGKWCADAWLAPSNVPNDDKEELEEGETGDTAPGKTLPKLKNPTTLSIIREHDAKMYGKVCLSPQRRSFGSGCSWKDMSSSSTTGSAAGGKDGQTTPSAGNNRDTHLDGNPEARRSTGSRSNFLPNSHSSHAHNPRVINHTPLRDQKGWKGEGGRGGERAGGKSYTGYRSKEIEEEPEWMAFGPSDRSEVIELVGFDEHEKEREIPKKEEQSREGVVVEEEVEGEGGSEVGRGAVSEEEGSIKTSEGSVGVEEGVVGVVRGVVGGEERKVVKEPENEFMLDGFDFSTSVSMCNALASDEEEEEDEKSSMRGRGGVTLPSTVSNPHELSSALMKALRVGEEETYRQSGHPVNALTLEEVHERENIHHHTQFPTQRDTDQSAFNRLVAVLQSSGAIQDEPTQPPLPQRLPRPPVPLAMPPKLYDQSIMSGTRVGDGGRGMESGGNSFGFMLEKELRFDEDFSSSSTASRMPTFRNSLSHSREPHLAKMEVPSLMRDSYGAPTKSPFPPPHRHSSHPHQAPPPSSRLSEKWVERSWIHPENPSMEYGGLQRPPVDPLGLPMMHHHHQSGRSSLHNRPPNSWAIEMEQRRRMELQTMREREREARNMMMAGETSLHSHHVPSKPNISLLPTAVMRQLHNSNPNHSLSDIASRTSQSSTDRLDQGDLSSRSAYSSGFGYPDIAGGVSHSRDYPYPTGHMRVPPRPQHRGGVGLYTPPPQYIPIPHGMPSQQNPYLQ